MSGPSRMFSSGRATERGGIIFTLMFLLFVVAVACILYVARYPLLRLAGSFWVVDEEPKNSDVIVILGDDNYNGDRATRAAELYKSGFAPHVIASGRFLRPYASIAELEEHDLIDRGVPKSAIVRLMHSEDDTREEAMAISQQLGSRGWTKVILVTSSYHTRRSRYICERLFPAGSILHVVAARDSEYDPDSWWESRRGMKIFFHEFVGMPVAMWEARHNSIQTSEPGFFDSVKKHIGILIPLELEDARRKVYSGKGLYYSAFTV